LVRDRQPLLSSALFLLLCGAPLPSRGSVLGIACFWQKRAEKAFEKAEEPARAQGLLETLAAVLQHRQPQAAAVNREGNEHCGGPAEEVRDQVVDAAIDKADFTQDQLEILPANKPSCLLNRTCEIAVAVPTMQLLFQVNGLAQLTPHK
jgi:hypothetical protein